MNFSGSLNAAKVVHVFFVNLAASMVSMTGALVNSTPFTSVMFTATLDFEASLSKRINKVLHAGMSLWQAILWRFSGDRRVVHLPDIDASTRLLTEIVVIVSLPLVDTSIRQLPEITTLVELEPITIVSRNVDEDI